MVINNINKKKSDNNSKAEIYNNRFVVVITCPALSDIKSGVKNVYSKL